MRLALSRPAYSRRTSISTSPGTSDRLRPPLPFIEKMTRYACDPSLQMCPTSITKQSTGRGKQTAPVSAGQPALAYRQLVQTAAGASVLFYARSIPPVGGHTEFADERAAYDALPEETKRRLNALVAEHSIFNSRARLGFTNFSDEERQAMPAVPQLLVRTIPEFRPQVALPGVPCRPYPRHVRARRPRAHR